MPRQETHVAKVRLWLSSLGVLVAVSISRHEAEMKLKAYVPMLMSDFPDAAFTVDSLNYVAKACAKGFPTYPEVYMSLGAWWREHRPPLSAATLARIAPPPPPAPRPDPTPEEIAHVEQIVRETTAILRASETAREDWRFGGKRFANQPRYLTPGQLDQLNPLPNGRKRTDAESRS